MVAVKMKVPRGPKYTLRYCKTPEEFTEMYKTGYSCMRPTKNNLHSGISAWKILQETGLWASYFYAYLPGIVGVLLLENGKPVLRTFVYKNIWLGRAYGRKGRVLYEYDDTGKCTLYGKLVELLTSAGYDIRSTGTTPARALTSFSVKAVKLSDGNLYCPIPHVDFMPLRRRGFYVQYKYTGYYRFSIKKPLFGKCFHLSNTYDHRLYLVGTTNIVAAN